MDLKSVLICFTSIFLVSVESKKDKALYCAVCRALVDEINWSIKEVDPLKTIETGSFRVDTHGNQARTDRPYARSETHMIELMESICEKMNNYAKTTDSKGKTSLVRTFSRVGKMLSLKNLSVDKSLEKKIRFYCDTVIEDHEEEMISLFKRENLPNIERAICADIAGACTGEDLSVPLPVASEEEENTDSDEDLEDDNKDEL